MALLFACATPHSGTPGTAYYVFGQGQTGAPVEIVIVGELGKKIDGRLTAQVVRTTFVHRGDGLVIECQSGRGLADTGDPRIFASFLYTARVEPIAGIARMLLIELAPRPGLEHAEGRLARSSQPTGISAQ
jgi:hypothetical protein